jgi:hypothetical protein
MRPRPVLIRAVPLIAGLACAVALALPALAAAGHAGSTAHPALAAPGLAAFVQQANGIAVNGYTSNGQAPGMQSNGPGVFTAEFSGMGTIAGTKPFVPNGNIQVTPVGETQATCSIAAVFAAFSTLNVQVYCTTFKGIPSASFWDMTVTQPKAPAHGVLDYAWVTRPNASYTLTGPDQFNSSHKANKVRHVSTGVYVVTMPGPNSASKGTVKVTSLGSSAGDCSLAGWTSSRTGQQFTVRCYGDTGGLQNRSFTIAYASSTNLMGHGGLTDANALANKSADLYQPKTQYVSRKGAGVTVVHLATGFYEVFFPGSGTTARKNGGSGDVQVTPAAGSDRHCNGSPVPQPRTPFVIVVCAGNNGKVADSGFTIQWVVNP